MRFHQFSSHRTTSRAKPKMTLFFLKNVSPNSSPTTCMNRHSSKTKTALPLNLPAPRGLIFSHTFASPRHSPFYNGSREKSSLPGVNVRAATSNENELVYLPTYIALTRSQMRARSYSLLCGAALYRFALAAGQSALHYRGVCDASCFALFDALKSSGDETG